MTFTYRHKKQIIIIILSLFSLILGGSFLYFSLKAEPVEAKEVLKVTKKESKVEKRIEKTITYKIDIKGAVVSPGIYTLEKDSRVMDAITMAGGLTESADTSVINLSKKIEDEMVIIVYRQDQVLEFEKTKELEKTVQEKCREGAEYGLKNDACIENRGEEGKQTEKISLNTATKEELMSLSGIGESKAIAIIDYREQNWPLEKIEDIINVSGIGESLFAKIKENITT